MAFCTVAVVSTVVFRADTVLSADMSSEVKESATKEYANFFPENSEQEQQQLLAKSYPVEEVVWLELGEEKSLAVLRHQTTGMPNKGMVVLFKTGVHSIHVDSQTVDDLSVALLDDAWDTLLVFLPSLPPPVVTLHLDDETEVEAYKAPVTKVSVPEESMSETDYQKAVNLRLRAAAELLNENGHSRAVFIAAGMSAPVLSLQAEVKTMAMQGVVLLNANNQNSQLQQNFFPTLDTSVPVLDVGMGLGIHYQQGSRKSRAMDERETCALDNRYHFYTRANLPAQSSKVKPVFNRSIKRVRSWLKKIK